MEKKKIAKFLLLAPAFSKKNLSSLLLVGFFFGVYVLAGGRVSSVPDLRPGETFGEVELETVPPESAPVVSNEWTVGSVSPSKEELAPATSNHPVTEKKLGLEETHQIGLEQKVANAVSAGQTSSTSGNPERGNESRDRLTDLEERLKKLR